MNRESGLHDGRRITVAVVEPTLTTVPVRPRWKYAWVWAGIWLAYLWQSFVGAWHEPDPARRWLAIVLLAAFAALFLGSFAFLPRIQRIGTPASRTVWPPAGLGLTVALAVVVLSGVLGISIAALLCEGQLPGFVYVAVIASSFPRAPGDRPSSRV